MKYETHIANKQSLLKKGLICIMQTSHYQYHIFGSKVKKLHKSPSFKFADLIANCYFKN